MGGEFSLLSGWLPVTVQVVAAGVVAGAVGWRTRRWRLRWVPAVALLGVVTAVAAAVRFASSTAGLAEQRRRQAAPSAFLGTRYTQSLAAGIHSRHVRQSRQATPRCPCTARHGVGGGCTSSVHRGLLACGEWVSGRRSQSGSLSSRRCCSSRRHRAGRGDDAGGVGGAGRCRDSRGGCPRVVLRPGAVSVCAAPLDVPLPLLSPARLATVLAPRTGQRVLEIGPGTGPAHQEKIVKFNELLANCVIYGTACDITAVVNAFTADGHPVDPDDLATVVPYITHTVRRFGDWVLDLSAPQALPVTRLDLTPGALFSAN